MRIAVFAILATTALLGACEQSRVDTGVASGAGQSYGQDASITAGDRTGIGQQDLGSGGGHSGVGGAFDGTAADRVFFSTDQYTLGAEARSTLDQQAAWLSRYPQTRIVLEGHADERGTREYNLALGDRRAAAVRDYLTARGVAPSRIRVISYGKERPSMVGFSDSSWAQNRRAVTVVQ